MEPETEFIVGFELKTLNGTEKFEAMVQDGQGGAGRVVQTRPFFVRAISKTVSMVSFENSPSSSLVGPGLILSQGIKPTFQVLSSKNSYGETVNIDAANILVARPPYFELVSFRVTKFGDKYKKEEIYQSFRDISSIYTPRNL